MVHGGPGTPRKRHSAERIVDKLREAEVDLSQGLSVKRMCRQIGVTDQTYYEWRLEYGGLKTDGAKKPGAHDLCL